MKIRNNHSWLRICCLTAFTFKRGSCSGASPPFNVVIQPLNSLTAKIFFFSLLFFWEMQKNKPQEEMHSFYPFYHFIFWSILFYTYFFEELQLAIHNVDLFVIGPWEQKFQFELKLNLVSCLEYRIIQTIVSFVFSLGSILNFKDTGLFMFIQNLHSLLSHQANCMWLKRSWKFWRWMWQGIWRASTSPSVEKEAKYGLIAKFTLMTCAQGYMLGGGRE